MWVLLQPGEVGTGGQFGKGVLAEQGGHAFDRCAGQHTLQPGWAEDTQPNNLPLKFCSLNYTLKHR